MNKNIMAGHEIINKTRKYLDYIENHLNNVWASFDLVRKNCADMRFIWDDYYYHALEFEVFNHDLSKLSKEELTDYRVKFYPCENEVADADGFLAAWQNHKNKNDHHWQTWTNKDYANPNEWEIHCAHMVIDWMAMGMAFGDTAKEYYEKNSREIELPEYAIKFIYEIFKRVC